MLELIDEREVLGKNFKVYGTWENPLFLAKDVAEWIDYAKTGKGSYDTSRMLKTVDDDEKLIRTIFVSGQNREAWFLTEDGLNEVLFQSRKPIAKEFKKQVKIILREVRTKGVYTTANLPPHLQTLIDLELRQQRVEQEVATHTEQISSIREVVALDTISWRKDGRELIKKISQTMGGYDFIREVQTQIYGLLEERASVNLNQRLTNKRRRMLEEGATKSKCEKVCKLDIIGEDKKLIEIYVAIVKEKAISSGVGLQMAEPLALN